MASAAQLPWQIWIDTGGTFTDCIAIDPSGKLSRLKVLSHSSIRGTVSKIVSSKVIEVKVSWPAEQDIFKGFNFRIVGTSIAVPIERVDLLSGRIHLQQDLPKGSAGQTIEISSGEEVPVLAARMLTGTALDEAFPRLEVRLGSTRGTNAILERKGARTVLLVTKGFRDLLVIGNQQRPDLFALQITKSQPLYDRVIEVEERVNAAGEVETALTPDAIESTISTLKKTKCESIAIALMNSYRNPVHELKLKKALLDEGFSYLSVSHQLSSQIKILSRAETTVANAYLDPIIDRYLQGIKAKLPHARVSVMTSAGSLVNSDAFFPKDSLLSGPAGGVVGAAIKATESGKPKVIAFDMGGTSTDVSLYHGRFDYRFESTVGSCKILSPSIAIETIAAGGGSICGFDGYRFTVGPQSAGASPGPACYGANGPLTITDVNVLLGRLDPGNFAIPIDPSKSAAALEKVLSAVRKATGRPLSASQALESFIRIANEKMAEAIRKISIHSSNE